MFLDSAGNGYLATCYTGTTVQLYKVTGGANYSQLGSDALVVFIAGDIAELAIVGNDIVFYKNSVETFRQTDTTFRTGLHPAIFEFDSGLRVDNHSDGASGQTVNLGLTSETDSVLVVTKRKLRTVGLNTETDSVLATTKKKSKAVGLATETDSVFSVSVVRPGQAGLPVETDSALSVSRLKRKAIGLITESDTAFTVSKVRSRVIGLTTEADSVLGIAKKKAKAVGLNTESDSAFSVSTSTPLVTSYFTNFPLTENPINQGGMFRVGDFTGFYKNPRSTPGKCFAADFVGAGFDDCIAHLINHAVPVNHRVTATIFRSVGYNPSDSHEVGLYLRMQIGVGAGSVYVRGYEFLFAAGGSFQIFRWEGTTHESENFTELTVTGAGPGTLANGDVISVQAIGSAFQVFKNGVQVATATDSTWTDGNPGMGFFVRAGDTTKENYCTTTWAAEGASTQVTVGLASETDTPFSTGKKKLRGIGLASEASSALACTHRKTKSIGLSLESDSALANRPLRLKAIGLSTETDSSFTLSKKKTKQVGLPFEVDSAFGVIGGEQVSGVATRIRRLGLGFG